MKISYALRVAILPLVLCGICESGFVFAAGLSTRFGVVLIENLTIGKRYSTREILGLPLSVTNKSAGPIVVAVEVMVPSGENDLVEGYEAIPDSSWIEIENEKLGIGPQMSGESDIIINIPNEKQYENRKYQVYIWSHTVEGTFRMGLKSTLLFTTVSEESAVKTKEEQDAEGTFEFDVEAMKIILKDVKPGKSFDVEEETGIVLKIRNNAEAAKRFKIESVEVSESHARLPAGFSECPNPSMLILDSDQVFALSPGAEKAIKMHMVFPEKDKFKGKNYLFLIHVAQESVGIYCKVYVSTAN